MKRLIFILLVLLSFIDVKAQFPSTDSLRNYNIVWITNNAARAFTNYRLHTLLAGMIDWIDTARTGGGGSIGIDSIAALNDSTLRYRINGTFRTFTYRGVYDARRKVDTAYNLNDSTIRFLINGNARDVVIRGVPLITDTHIPYGDTNNRITSEAALSYTAGSNRLNAGTGNFADSLLVGRLRTGTASDSIVVWDNVTKALKKILQSSITTNFVPRISSIDQEIVRFNGTNGDIQGTPGVTANGSGNFAVPNFWTLTNAGGVQYAMLPLSHAYSTPTTNTTNTPFDYVTGAQTQSSGNLEMFRIATNYNQTSTAGATDFIIRRTETAIGSGTHNFLRFDGGAAGTTERFSVDRLGRVKVGQLDNGTASDSVVVWDASTKHLKKIAQSSISGSSGNLTTIVRKPILALEGDSTLGIPDTLDFAIGYGLMRHPTDSSLQVDSTKFATQFDISTIGGGDTSLVTNIRDFGAVGDGVTDNTIAINNAIQSIQTTGKRRVYAPAGTYKISSSYLDTALVDRKQGIIFVSDMEFFGDGDQTKFILADSLTGSTFADLAPPVTFSTNTDYWHMFSGTNVSNVKVHDIWINGRLTAQNNKADNLDAYDNPQDSTFTDSVQTDGIRFTGGTNNEVYNVRIDSVVGYGISYFQSTYGYVHHNRLSTSINGNVYLARGSYYAKISNNIITASWSDNIRVRTSYASIGPYNDISWTKPNVNPAVANFAGIYVERLTPTSQPIGEKTVGVTIFKNTLHDNSSYGIDFNNRDTILYTWEAPSGIIEGNVIYRNANGGITMHMPQMTIINNDIVDNGADSLGYTDPFVYRGTGIGPTQYAVDSRIDNNRFRNRNGKPQIYGVKGAQPDYPRNLQLTNNSQVGGADVYFATSNTHTNPWHGNWCSDSTFTLKGDIFTTATGSLLLAPRTNSVNLFHTLSNGALGLNSSLTGEASVVGIGGGSNGLGQKYVYSNAYLSGASGNISGRAWLIHDFQSVVNRMGMNGIGELFLGPSGASYSARFRQPGVDLHSLLHQIEFKASSSVFAGNSTQSATYTEMANGTYTNAGTIIAARAANLAVTTGNIIGGAGVARGAIGNYAVVSGSSSAGANIGGLFASLSALKNVGVMGDATVTQRNDANARSIGVIGYALRNNASAVHIGGYFSLIATEPTFVSAALIADNAAQTDPIFLGRDNGVVKFSIKDNGHTAINTTGGSTDIDMRMLYVNGSIGANKDSITTITTPATNFLLTLDTAAAPELGRFKKILPSNLGFASQSALNDTAAAIRSAITTPTPSYEMFYSDNSSTTVGNTTTETTLLGTGTGSAAYSTITAGSVLSIKGNGILSTAGTAGVPTLEFTIGTYSLGMNLTGLSSSLNNVFYDYDFELIPVATGSNQDAIIHCIIHVNDGTGKIFAYSTRASAAFTTTGTPSADVTADWDTADAANTLTSYKNVIQIFRK